VGLTWKDLDTAQRAKLVDALGRLAGANYAARMADFSGEHFETIGTESASQGTILVRTRVVDGDGEPIPLDYRCGSTPELGRASSTCSTTAPSASWRCAVRNTRRCSRRAASIALLEALEKKIAEQAPASTS